MTGRDGPRWRHRQEIDDRSCAGVNSSIVQAEVGWVACENRAHTGARKEMRTGAARC